MEVAASSGFTLPSVAEQGDWVTFTNLQGPQLYETGVF